MKITATLAVAVLALATCSGGDDGGGDESAEATEPATETLWVRVTAEKVGLGCVTTMERARRSGLDVGNDSRLTVRDGDGTALGTGTFNLSPGAETCDWTAEVADVPADVDFYELDVGATLATLSRSEVESARWRVDLHVTYGGDVRVDEGA